MKYFEHYSSGATQLLYTVLYMVTTAGLTIRGPLTNVKRGPFLVCVARIFSGGALFLQKKVTIFLVVVVTFKPTLNIQTFKRQYSVLKLWQLIGGPWRRGPLPWYNRHNG